MREVYRAMIQAAPDADVSVSGGLIDGGWKQMDNLLYRLGPDGSNCDEINVQQVNGSRLMDERSERAARLLDLILVAPNDGAEGE
jgi:hypothetical protein